MPTFVFTPNVSQLASMTGRNLSIVSFAEYNAMSLPQSEQCSHFGILPSEESGQLDGHAYLFSIPFGCNEHVRSFNLGRCNR